MLSVRETADGCYAIAWDNRFGDEPVDVFAGRTPQSIDMQNPVATGRIRRATVSGLSPGLRHYFALQPRSGAPAIAAQRDVPFSGAVNYRDLGGYRTVDGRETKWGTLYRSGHLSRFTPEDRDYFLNLDVTTICDFRRHEEIETEASIVPPGTETHVVPITPGARDTQHITRMFADAAAPEDVADAMVDIMRSLVVESAAQYRKLFEMLLAHETGAFLMNCSAGKERTGVGTAIVLMALGVPRETIEYDFMLSQDYYPVEPEVARVREKYAVDLPGEAGRALIMPLLETRREYIRVVFAEIDRQFASDEDFIRSTYDVSDRDLADLRAIFTG